MRTFAFAAALGAALLPAAVPAATGNPQERIAQGFTQLGMSSDESACYGRTITSKLDPEGSDKAASIVESAKNANDVREGVKGGGLDMVQAFMAAQTACGS